MTATRILCLVTAVLLFLSAVAMAASPEDVLGVIPADSLGFVLLNRLGATDAKIVTTGRQAQLPAPSLLTMLKTSTGIQKGLDEKGSAALVALPGADDDSLPAVILYVPVTDFDELVGQLKPKKPGARIVKVEVMDAEFLVGKRGGYAVFAEPKHRGALREVLKSSAGVSAELAPMQQWLSENDVSAVITRSGVKLLTAKGIEGLRQVKGSLTQMPEEMQENMKAAVAVFEIYEKMLEAIGDEVTLYAYAARIDQQGSLHLTDWTQFTPGGAAAKVLAGIGPAEGNPLAGLPEGPFVVAGGGALSEGLIQAMMGFSIEMMKAAPQLYGLDEGDADKLAELSNKTMKGMKGMSLLLAVGTAGDPVYSNLAGVIKVDDSTKFLADYRKYIGQMNELIKNGKSAVLTETKIKDVEIDGRAALQLEMKYPKTPAAEGIPGYEEMLEKMFGPGGVIVAWLAAADEHSIVSSYTNKDMLQQSLALAKASRPGLAADKQVAQTAALLPSGAQWVAYLSPQGTVAFINRLIPTFNPAADESTKLPDFPATPPIGMAAETVPNGLRTYLVVPAPVLKALGGYVTEVQKMMMRGMDVEFELDTIEVERESAGDVQ